MYVRSHTQQGHRRTHPRDIESDKGFQPDHGEYLEKVNWQGYVMRRDDYHSVLTIYSVEGGYRERSKVGRAKIKWRDACQRDLTGDSLL